LGCIQLLAARVVFSCFFIKILYSPAVLLLHLDFSVFAYLEKDLKTTRTSKFMFLISLIDA